MTITVSGLYDHYSDASRAVTELESKGIPSGDISVISNTSAATRKNVAADAETGAGVGAAVGGVGGLLAGLGMIPIPGFGPVVAGGWLVTTLVGAAVGGATGGIVGGMTHAGMPEDDAHVYAEGVARGGTLVTAKVDDGKADTVRSILEHWQCVDISKRRSDYEAEGWTKFHEPSLPSRIETRIEEIFAGFPPLL